VGFDVMEAGAPTASTRPFWVDLSMNGITDLFLGLLCVFATFACGLVPALHVSRTNASDILKEGGRGTAGGVRVRRWTGAFVVAELALSLVLLAEAGLLWRSFLAHYNTDVVIVQGISPRDPITLVAVASLLIIVAAAASVLSARRATRVDPVVALRAE
jgi:hypothetical protein